MNVEILYFSGTGNTWWVVKHICQRLEEGGWHTSMVPFETRARLDLPSPATDLFGLAFPTYGTGPPPNVDEYARETIEGTGEKCFVVTTYAMYNGSTATDTAKVLGERGFEPVLAYGVKMPMNIHFPKVTPRPIIPLIPEPPKAARIKREALETIDKISGWLLSGKRKFRTRDPVNHMISRLQYNLYRRGLQHFQDRWSADQNCNLCKLCEKICPRGNIRVTDEAVEFGESCMFCGRCYSFCPEQAIQFDNRTQDYYRYPGVGEGYRPHKVEYI